MMSPSMDESVNVKHPRFDSPNIMSNIFFENFQKAQNQMESNLLLACSTSDIPALTQILDNPDSVKEIDFGCVDLLGRTALQLTIENEDVEVDHYYGLNFLFKIRGFSDKNWNIES